MIDEKVDSETRFESKTLINIQNRFSKKLEEKNFQIREKDLQIREYDLKIKERDLKIKLLNIILNKYKEAFKRIEDILVNSDDVSSVKFSKIISILEECLEYQIEFKKLII